MYLWTGESLTCPRTKGSEACTKTREVTYTVLMDIPKKKGLRHAQEQIRHADGKMEVSLSQGHRGNRHA